MGKFTEYLKLIPKAVLNPEKIIEGVINDVKLKNGSLSEDKQEEIIRRRLICFDCPLNSINAQKSEEYKALYGEFYKTDRPDLHCSICSCNIELKTASLDSDCGLTAYNEKNPNNTQKLKWTYYKQENK